MIHHVVDLPRAVMLVLLAASWWHGAVVGGAVVALVTVARGWGEP
ncbi:MAG: hypothetical protein Q8S73_37035 [Deltaproteobacteria bacterium]|nr:hypothetical protein [Myxococcales bacterium]MDP3219766.1 hypothetical protein [Deltaproteobacteria bacterium]